MKALSVLLFIPILLLYSQVQGQTDESSDKQLSIGLFISTPIILVGQTGPTFGHRYSNARSLPLHGGLNLSMEGRKKWGFASSLFYFPMRFQVDYQFISQPDPLVPEISAFQLDFLGLSMMGEYTLLSNQSFKLYAAAGLDLLLQIAYSDETTYTDDSFRTDGQKDVFERAIGAPVVKLCGKWTPNQKAYFGLHAATRYWGVELENREYLDSKQLNFSFGLDLGFFL